MEIVDHLLARPVLRMDASIDYQAHCAPDICFQTAIVVVGVLVEADFFSQTLGVESPSLGVRSVVSVFAKLRNAG